MLAVRPAGRAGPPGGFDPDLLEEHSVLSQRNRSDTMAAAFACGGSALNRRIVWVNRKGAPTGLRLA